MSYIDFRKSSFSWETKTGSIGKFNIESSLYYNNRLWYLGSKVFACDVYSNKSLFIEPFYSFQPLFTEDEHIIFRFYEDGIIRHTRDKNENIFKNCSFSIEYLDSMKAYSEKVINPSAYSYHTTLVATDFVVQFPVKHINFMENPKQFQVETGLVAIPFNNELLPAYLAFNKLDSCEVLMLSSSGKKKINLSKAKINLNIY